LPGDFGFDPLRLGTDPDTLKWYVEGELTNGRWAMAAVAGILFTDALGVTPKWWEAGAQVDSPLSLPILIAFEVALFAVLEYKRYEGFKKTGETGFLAFFPFDPLGLKSDTNKVKEVMNGRLAMTAFVGFCSQAAVTGKGPIESLQYHLEDPLRHNIYTSPVGTEATVAAVAFAITPIIIEATKSLRTSEVEPLYPWKSNE